MTVANVQGEGLRNGQTPDDIPDGFVAWEEHLVAWRVYHELRPDESAKLINERGGFSYREMKDLLGHNPTTWVPRDAVRYGEFVRKPEDMPPEDPVDIPVEPVYSHIWYVSGTSSICKEPDESPQYPILFDTVEAPNCEKCAEVMLMWINWWIRFGKKTG